MLQVFLDGFQLLLSRVVLLIDLNLVVYIVFVQLGRLVFNGVIFGLGPLLFIETFLGRHP